MKVWTVSSRDDTDTGCDSFVSATYIKLDDAIEGCVQYVFDRIAWREDFAKAMASDENHPDARKFFSKRRSDDTTVIRWGCTGKLREYVRKAVETDHEYHIVGENNSFFDFDVDENNLEGTLWCTVTWGDSDCEDPEFTTPWPEVFTSEQKAIDEFYYYAVDLKKEYGLEVSEGLRPWIESQLRKDGRCQIDLEDGCCVSCVLYSMGASNVRG